MALAYTCVDNRTQVKCLMKATALVGVLALLSGCAMGTTSTESDLPTSAISIADSTPTIASNPFTPELSASQNPSTTDRLLDEDTIRLAVTTADLSKLPGNAISWANQATGSSGIISDVQQRVEAGQTCRSFKATRSAYDGVILYEGDVCLDGGSGWWTRMLRPFGDNNT